ncbi:MAG: hypothetical protein QOJ74_22, partial [Ilumatobacteraceae bacterium]|nr:hypothetical protein [Ilumatobacteraceae bacterium]
GYQPIAPGGTLDIEVAPGVSTLALTVRCRSARGVRYAACSVAISDDPVPPAPDETWQLQPASGNPGHAFVFRCGSGDTLHRPVLIAEGFPGGQSPQMLAEALGQFDLLGRLRSNGHDIVVVGFDDGTATIQSNAGVIREAIAQVRARTADPLVVGGMSMGGLITRYALTEMEHDGVEHGAAVYLSIDTPHGPGAYTTVPGQWLVNNFTALSPAYLGLTALLDAPSNLQFIGLIEQDGTVGPHPLRTTLLDDLRRLGEYPQRLVKLAIACGQGAGYGGPPPTAPILAWFNDGFADITLLPMPAGGPATAIAFGATLGAPSRPEPLMVSSEVCWETVPGALNVLNAEVVEVVSSLGCTVTSSLGLSSSMPTVSALAASVGLNDPIPPAGSGASPFDDYIFSATDQLHLQFTGDVVDWIVDRIEMHQQSAPSTTAPKGPAMNPATFNPNDPTFIADPYPTYAWFREHLPVAPISLVPGTVPPTWWVFLNADVRTILEDTDTFLKRASGPGAPPSGPPPPVFGSLWALPPGLLSSDPPRHTVIRQAVEPSFLTAIVDAQALAEHAVEQALATLSGTRRIELVQDFALPVPAMVLAEVLGLPANDMSILIQWVEAVATAHNITQPPSVLGFGGICAMAMRTYYDALVTENQTQSGGGMLAGVCPHIGKDLTLHDVEAVMSDMLVAGFLTTTYLISTGIRSLLAHPDQADAIRADPSLLPAAIEEMLRFDSPAPLLDRQVAVPTTLGGVSLQPGARVVAAVASANRDPQAFENPDVFDVRRVDTTQLGFGDGIHYCIGAPLARLVAPAAIAGLLKLPNLRINGIEQWQPDPYLRGLTSLPMAYD